jgi:hypothetical protein
MNLAHTSETIHFLSYVCIDPQRILLVLKLPRRIEHGGYCNKRLVRSDDAFGATDGKYTLHRVNVIWSKFRWIMMACIGDCTLREVE